MIRGIVLKGLTSGIYVLLLACTGCTATEDLPGGPGFASAAHGTGTFCTTTGTTVSDTTTSTSTSGTAAKTVMTAANTTARSTATQGVTAHTIKIPDAQSASLKKHDAEPQSVALTDNEWQVLYGLLREPIWRSENGGESVFVSEQPAFTLEAAPMQFLFYGLLGDRGYIATNRGNDMYFYSVSRQDYEEMLHVHPFTGT